MYGYIYETTNLINGKKYIGQHKSNKFDNWYLGSGITLKKAIKKYGKENFYTRIIEKIDTGKEDLNNREIYWIEYFDAVKSKEYYNNSCGGEEKGWKGLNNAIKLNLREHSCYKRKMSDETKEKISKANKGKKRTKEQREQFSKSHKGQLAWNKGRKTPIEIRNKLSKAHKGQKPWNKGIKLSEESREKMSQAKIGKQGYWKGKKFSEESKKKMSEAKKGKPSLRKGKKLSEETKEKISESHKGKIPWNKGKQMSDDFKRKLSEAHRKSINK